MRSDDSADFARVWDAVIDRLRASDLLSDAEMTKLQCGGRDGLPAPLLTYAGVLPSLLSWASDIVVALASGSPTPTDEAFVSAVLPGGEDGSRTLAVLRELQRCLAAVLCAALRPWAVAQGVTLPQLERAVAAALAPREGEPWASFFLRVLKPNELPMWLARAASDTEGGVATAVVSHTSFGNCLPQAQASWMQGGLASALLQLAKHVEAPASCIAGDGVDTIAWAQRGALSAAVCIAHLLAPSEDFDTRSTDARSSSSATPSPVRSTSNAERSLLSSAALPADVHCAVSKFLLSALALKADTSPPPLRATASAALDVAFHPPLTSSDIRTFRAAGRRLSYLLTVTNDTAAVKAEDATRRICMFVQSLYMHSMPPVSAFLPPEATDPGMAAPKHSAIESRPTDACSTASCTGCLDRAVWGAGSILDMPSFCVISPIYGEAVLYPRESYLVKPGNTGTRPMDYLQAQYGLQWENALERLGVADETSAWAATCDADGQPVDGELELRFWASHRGQTLARCAFGVMEYSRALALLAEIELEREYVALEAASRVHAVGCPSVLPSTTLQRIRADAAAAAQWWVDARFSLTMACQRYGERGTPLDMAKRDQVDALMSRYGPRLRVAYFDKVTVPSKPQPEPPVAAHSAMVGAAAGCAVGPVHVLAPTSAADSAAFTAPVTRWYSVSSPAAAHVLFQRYRCG